MLILYFRVSLSNIYIYFFCFPSPLFNALRKRDFCSIYRKPCSRIRENARRFRACPTPYNVGTWQQCWVLKSRQCIEIGPVHWSTVFCPIITCGVYSKWIFELIGSDKWSCDDLTLFSPRSRWHREKKNKYEQMHSVRDVSTRTVGIKLGDSVVYGTLLGLLTHN